MSSILKIEITFDFDTRSLLEYQLDLILRQVPFYLVRLNISDVQNCFLRFEVGDPRKLCALFSAFSESYGYSETVHLN